MRTLFHGDVDISYSQLYIYSGGPETLDPLGDAFSGQENGLCGAALPGFLFLTTGLNVGYVPYTVERHDEAPPVDDAWEDIVEVSFRPATPQVMLVEWGGEHAWPLDLDPTDLRVRYCARGMDAAGRAGSRLDPEGPELDRYLLQFWPAPPGPERVVKQTSEQAAYRHRAAKERPPPAPPAEPPPAPTIDDVMGAVLWGDDRPDERVVRAGGNAWGLATLDRALLDAVAEADAETQRAIAQWAARRAYDAAGLSSVVWIAPALEAVERGEPLPAPFDDQGEVWRLFMTDERMPRTVIRLPGGGPDNVSQQAAAIPALFGAAESDPLRAAVDALHAAGLALGDESQSFFSDVRRLFLAD